MTSGGRSFQPFLITVGVIDLTIDIDQWLLELLFPPLPVDGEEDFGFKRVIPTASCVRRVNVSFLLHEP